MRHVTQQNIRQPSVMVKVNSLHYLPRERKQNYDFNKSGVPCTVNVYFINIIKDILVVGISEHGTSGKH